MDKENIEHNFKTVRVGGTEYAKPEQVDGVNKWLVDGVWYSADELLANGMVVI